MTTEDTSARGTARTVKYQAVREQLRHDIESGMQPHDPLPSERELMTRYGVSRITVREALAGLAEDGLVYRRQGAGTFVADPDTISKSLSLTSFSDDIRARRMRPGSRLVDAVVTEADVAVAHDLDVSPGTAVWHLERVRTADGIPMCLENVWLPTSLLGVDREVGQIESLYEHLDAIGATPERAEQTIRATVVDARQAALLEVPAHSPALEVHRVTFDERGRRIERGWSLYRGDRYDFQVSISRRRRT